MTDLEFLDRAESVLKAVEACCDRINEDTEAAAANRATLPQTLVPKMTTDQPVDPAALPPAKPASR